MMKFKRKDKKKTWKYWLISILVAAILIPSGWLLFTRMEGRSPDITLELDTSFLRAESEIRGRVTDPESGVRKFWAALVTDDKEIVLANRDYEKQDQPAGSSAP